MKQFELIALVVLMCLLGGRPAFSDDYTYDFDWTHVPPEDAEEVVVYLSYLTFTNSLKPEKINGLTKIRVYGDSVYLPVVSFTNQVATPGGGKNNIKYETYKGWLMGVTDGNRIVFKNDGKLADIKVTRTHESWLEEEKTTEEDVEVYVRGIDDLGEESTYFHNSSDGYDYNATLPFHYTGEDVVGEFRKDKNLVCNLNSGMLLGNLNYSYLDYYEDSYRVEYPPSKMMLPGLIMGEVSEAAPESLPAPKLSTKLDRSNLHYHGGWVYEYAYVMLDVRLNIVNFDGTLIDPDRLYIVVKVDGGKEETYKFDTYGNPYSLPCVYEIIAKKCDSRYGDEYELDTEMEAYCYYLNKDGSRVVSPRVIKQYTGIRDIQVDAHEDEGAGNGKIYDLTGREVREGTLSPGIYIRNGRKFLVRK